VVLAVLSATEVSPLSPPAIGLAAFNFKWTISWELVLLKFSQQHPGISLTLTLASTLTLKLTDHQH
jgi:hypothetical protein